MTVDEVIEKLMELRKQGHGKKPVGMATNWAGDDYACGRAIGNVNRDEHGNIWIEELVYDK